MEKRYRVHDLVKFDEVVERLNKYAEENERLKNDCGILVQSNQDYRKENEQLKEENRKLRLENGKLTHDLFWANKMVEELKGDDVE